MLRQVIQEQNCAPAEPDTRQQDIGKIQRRNCLQMCALTGRPPSLPTYRKERLAEDIFLLKIYAYATQLWACQ